MAMVRVVIKKVLLICTPSVKLRTKRPAQLVNGPGSTGRKLPRTPNIINKIEQTIRKISIELVLQIRRTTVAIVTRFLSLRIREVMLNVKYKL